MGINRKNADYLALAVRRSNVKKLRLLDYSVAEIMEIMNMKRAAVYDILKNDKN